MTQAPGFYDVYHHLLCFPMSSSFLFVLFLDSTLQWLHRPKNRKLKTNILSVFSFSFQDSPRFKKKKKIKSKQQITAEKGKRKKDLGMATV